MAGVADDVVGRPAGESDTTTELSSSEIDKCPQVVCWRLEPAVRCCLDLVIRQHRQAVLCGLETRKLLACGQCMYRNWMSGHMWG